MHPDRALASVEAALAILARFASELAARAAHLDAQFGDLTGPG